MRARKRFGQHFLTDESVLHRIAQAVSLAADDPVLEIGPGHGALTDVLADQPRRYLAVEIDRDLTPLLAARYPHIELINEDVMRVNLHQLLEQDQGWRVVGNLPYNISSVLIMALVDCVRAAPDLIRDMHFMLQMEMAQRLAAQPHSKAWGRLSVLTQLLCDVDILFDVGPECFSPPPKVDSAVIRMQPRSDAVELGDIRCLDRLLRMAFAQRRKRISNALKELHIDWELAAVDPGLRADDISAASFVRLAQQIEQPHADRE